MSGKPRKKPQVNSFMSTLLGYYDYLANTLIFIIVGRSYSRKSGIYMECIRHLITHLRNSAHFSVYHDYEALSCYAMKWQ